MACLTGLEPSAVHQMAQQLLARPVAPVPALPVDETSVKRPASAKAKPRTRRPPRVHA
jgi:hypothetical protein